MVTAGVNLGEAFQRFETLEFVGRTIIKGRQLGEVRFLTGRQIEVADQRPTMLVEFQREEPSEFQRRSCAGGFASSYAEPIASGSLSARKALFQFAWMNRSFLITPFQVDRGMLDPRGSGPDQERQMRGGENTEPGHRQP